jgi:biopolymer transport protein TolR
MHMRAASSTLESNINVTPLVDICLVLLIIFMVITPVIVNGVPVKLPKTVTSYNIDAPKQLKVTVNADGTVFLNALAVRAEQVAGEVQRLHAANPSASVAVRGDKAVRYGEVVSVLDACRAAGYDNVGLVSEPADKP